MGCVSLEDVKKALGITGYYQDDTLSVYFDETMDYIENAGVKRENITKGIVARGVLDLWNNGAGDGKLSDYFVQRVTQLSYK